MAIDDVSDLSRRVQYTAGAGQTAFTYPFRIFDEGDLDVYVDDVQYTLGTMYSVTGVDNDLGGSVIFTTGLSAGAIVTIYSDTAIDRDTDYQQNGPWTSARLNSELDKFMVISQELRAKISRAIRGSILGNTVAEMPSAADRASKYLWFNASGDPTVVTGDASQPLTHSVYLVYPGTGETAIAVPADYTPGAYDLSVYVNGVKQVVGVDYTETSANLITLTTPATTGDVIEFSIGEVFDVTLVRTGREEQSFTGLTAPTITLTTASYTPGAHEVDVFFNGALLATADYTETNSTTITLGFTPVASDQFRVIVGRAVNVTNVSRGQVGGALYPQSAAEIAAGVTPTDYGYAPGDVRRYGATGLTDDTTAVASALLSSDDVLLTLRCKISSQLTVTRDGQRISGKGFYTGLVALSGGFDVLVSEANDVAYENFGIFGGATGQTTSQKGISATVAAPALRNHVRDMWFSGLTAGEGLNIAVKGDTGSDTWTVDNITVDRLWGSSNSTGYGVLIGECDGWRVNDSVFRATSGRGRHAVYISAGSTDCIATDCDAYGFYSSGFTAYTTAAQPESIDVGFVNCTAVDCCSAGLSEDGAVSFFGKITRPFQRGCKVIRSGRNGISANAFGTTMNDFVSVGGEVWDSEYIGIAVSGVTRSSIEGGSVSESSQTSAGTHSNIDIRTDGTTAATKVSIRGVRSVGALAARSPLRVDSSAPAPSGITVKGCDFEAGVTDHAEFGGIAATTDIQVEKAISGATPSVAGYNNFLLSNGGATNVTAFPNAVEGQTIRVRFANSNSTVIDAAGMQLAGGANFAGTADDILTLQYRSSVWYETGRSVN